MKKLIRNGLVAINNHKRKAVVAGAAVLGTGQALAIDTTAAATEFTDAATAGGEIIAAALGVAALLMAGFMLVRRL